MTNERPGKTLLIDLLRHGKPTGGEILRGRVNPELTPLGWQQMREAAGLSEDNKLLKTAPAWTHVFSSSLARCSAFAEQAAAAHDLPVHICDEWQEIDYGDWDGKPVGEVWEAAQKQFRAFRKDKSKLQPPNGESFLDFEARITGAWEDLLKLEDGSHVLVVTHGGAMRVILPLVLGMPVNNSFPLHIPFACMSRISINVEPKGVRTTLVFHNRAQFE